MFSQGEVGYITKQKRGACGPSDLNAGNQVASTVAQYTGQATPTGSSDGGTTTTTPSSKTLR